ncbi:uncharacterized protein LOC6556101 [Drosophila erecta]|uniref:Uncharacterized protein n=1 Tax=Drosophila erecta TaxID=7220 RepID=B3PAG5_DROER|nr:uncharacterized protein LOC6556101 [Drosophila erecta]EDV45148.1 uncharacterized protein Dere_GG13058 [Drosophila erecta]
MEGLSDENSGRKESSGEASRLGLLARLDRLLRRWLPGYSFIRGKRNSSSETSMTQGCSFGRQAVRRRGGRRNDKREVYLDTGIAKSEFCVQLETLLRNKLLKKQQELSLKHQERDREREREGDREQEHNQPDQQ